MHKTILDIVIEGLSGAVSIVLLLFTCPFSEIFSNEETALMKFKDKVIVVTGAGRGIGRGLCERFAQESPAGIVVADLDEDKAQETAEIVGGTAFACDVAVEQSIKELVVRTQETYGPIDLFCANAGLAFSGGPELPDEKWKQMMDIHVMSHVWSARAVLPGMLERGHGCLLHTASAAGLLTELTSAPYSVSKHAAVAFAEWLAIKYGSKGIQVACLCPQGVRTRMIDGEHPMSQHLQKTSISVEELAEATVQCLRDGQFLILPHPEVKRFMENRAGNHERWLGGMQQLRESLFGRTED